MWVSMRYTFLLAWRASVILVMGCNYTQLNFNFFDQLFQFFFLALFQKKITTFDVLSFFPTPFRPPSCPWNTQRATEATIKEVLPKSGLVYSEKGELTEVLCKPKIMPIKVSRDQRGGKFFFYYPLFFFFFFFFSCLSHHSSPPLLLCRLAQSSTLERIEKLEREAANATVALPAASAVNTGGGATSRR